MRHLSTLGIVILPFLLLSCHIACSQSVPPPTRNGQASASGQAINHLPVGSHHRPKLSLQNALKIAEAYIDKEHIDASSYWLYRAKFILYGDQASADKDKIAGWHFCWVNDSGALGDYIEIFLSMDGKAIRTPSM